MAQSTTKKVFYLVNVSMLMFKSEEDSKAGIQQRVVGGYYGGYRVLILEAQVGELSSFFSALM